MRRFVSLLLASLAFSGCGIATLPASPAPQRLEALRAKLPRVEAVRFAQVDARLYRGGLPSAADLAALDKVGVKTIISLQNGGAGHEKATVDAEKQRVEQLGMKFVNLSLPWRKAPPEAMVKTFFKVFADPDAVPAFVHCKQGRDRTGTMSAIYRVQFNAYTPEKAFEEMLTFGFEPKDYPFYAQYVKDFKPLKLSTGGRAIAFSVAR